MPFQGATTHTFATRTPNVPPRAGETTEALNEALTIDVRHGLASELRLATSHFPVTVAGLPASTRSARSNTIVALLAALHAKDPYTAEHSVRVEALAANLTRRLRLTPAVSREIRIGALLHDVGKIGIQDCILKKPSRLTDDEYETMKRHPAMGVSILRPIAFLEPLLAMVMHHHEWYGGTGYPDRLRGQDIPFGSRLIHIVDCIDAMGWPRTYRAGMSITRIVEELQRGTGGQFDPDIAAAAIAMLTEPAAPGHQPLPTITAPTEAVSARKIGSFAVPVHSGGTAH